MKFKKYEFNDGIFTDWETLYNEIPKLIERKLNEIIFSSRH